MQFHFSDKINHASPKSSDSAGRIDRISQNSSWKSHMLRIRLQ